MTKLLDPNRSVLVLIDYQTRLMPAIHDGDRVLNAALFIAQVARELGVPVLGTTQQPRLLGPNDERVSSLCEHVLDKTHFSAVADGLLEAIAQHAPGADQIVLAGCEAHVCLMQTALEVRQAGYASHVVAQACGSRRAEDKAVAMRRLELAGVTPLCAEMLAFEWMRACTHPSFKTVLANIKSQPLD